MSRFEKLVSPLSAQQFRDLVSDAAEILAASRVTARFASTTGSRGRPGPTWISVTAPQAYGRIMRRGDGSFVCTAYRTPDGAQLRAASGARIQRTDFADLIAAVAQPPRPHVQRVR